MTLSWCFFCLYYVSISLLQTIFSSTITNYYTFYYTFFTNYYVITNQYMSALVRFINFRLLTDACINLYKYLFYSCKLKQKTTFQNWQSFPDKFVWYPDKFVWYHKRNVSLDCTRFVERTVEFESNPCLYRVFGKHLIL